MNTIAFSQAESLVEGLNILSVCGVAKTGDGVAGRPNGPWVP